MKNSSTLIALGAFFSIGVASPAMPFLASTFQQSVDTMLFVWGAYTIAYGVLIALFSRGLLGLSGEAYWKMYRYTWIGFAIMGISAAGLNLLGLVPPSYDIAIGLGVHAVVIIPIIGYDAVG